MSDDADDTPPDFDGATDASQVGVELPLLVNAGPVYEYEYTTPPYNTPVKISLDVKIIASWEDQNEGHHWMELIVWLDGKHHHSSGETNVTNQEGQKTTVSLSDKNKTIERDVPAGKQHVVRIRHDTTGAKAFAMRIVGTVTRM